MPRYLKLDEFGNKFISAFYSETAPKKYFDIIQELRSNSLLLKDVPNHFKTQEICEIAIRSNSQNIDSVPNNIITYDFAKFVLQQDGNLIKHFIDNSMFNYQQLKELCLEAVKQNGLVLKFLHGQAGKFDSERHRIREFCKELCFEAVKQNGLALEFVPKNFQPLELCKAAVNQNELAAIFISVDNLNNEMLLLFNKTKIGFVKLPPDTECLISREPIAEKEKYKVCSLKNDHIISYDSYISNKNKNICEYCKSELQEQTFFNIESTESTETKSYKKIIFDNLELMFNKIKKFQSPFKLKDE